MAVDFLAVLNPPPSEQDIVNTFWSLAPASLRQLAIDSLSEINITIMAMIRGDANLWASVGNIGQQLVDLETSERPWLDLLAQGRYDVTPQKPIATVGNVYLKNTGGQPITIAPTMAAANGVTFSAASQTLLAGYSASFTFAANQTGPQGNLPLSAFTLVGNPSITFSDTGNPNDLSWIVTQGQGNESSAHLRQRCYDVIHARSSGGAESIAAQIRIATSNQVWRVFVPRFSSNVYVAAQFGAASPTWNAAALAAAVKYSSNSISPVLIGCATPITQTTMRFTGNLDFASGTPFPVVNGVLQGLSDYVNSLKICTGDSQDQKFLADLERKSISLDTSQSLIPSFSVWVNGTEITELKSPIPAPPGTIYNADLSGITVSTSL
jgi:hypothetical protein